MKMSYSLEDLETFLTFGLKIKNVEVVEDDDGKIQRIDVEVESKMEELRKSMGKNKGVEFA